MLSLKVFASIFIVAFLLHMLFYWHSRSTKIIGLPESQRLNYYLPEYDFAEKHKIVIHSSPEKLFKAIHSVDISESKVIKTLLMLRNIFSRLNPGSKPENQIQIRLKIEELGFFILEEVKNQEVVIGLGGKFWQPTPDMIKLSNTTDFISFNQTGYSKAAWNFYIERNDDGTVTLSTETRVLCLGEQVKCSFRFYWGVIRPYSGWIRLEILKMIKEQAENH